MTSALIASEIVAPYDWHRVRIGHMWIDGVTFDRALDAIGELVARRQGGAVFTPNVDHLLLVEENSSLRMAYSRADLVVADGMPVVWASHLLGTPLPEKVSGSDLIVPLARLAAASGWRVYLVGGAPGVAAAAAARLRSEFRVNVVGHDAPVVMADGSCANDEELFGRLRRARADLVFAAFGAPKQELWIDRARSAIAPAVGIGVGASLDFLAGQVRRAPRWMSQAGLEWGFRLAQEPRRLWRRYLVRDPQFVAVVARTWRTPRRQRVCDPPRITRATGPINA